MSPGVRHVIDGPGIGRALSVRATASLARPQPAVGSRAARGEQR
jgi:hypothetical protein